MAKMSRTKGKRAELEIVHILNEMYGFNVRRGDCFRHEPDIVGITSIHPEVKHLKELKLSTWLKQATEAAEKYHDGVPAVFHRKNREPWFVSMLKDDYEKMEPQDVNIKVVTGAADPAKDIVDCDAVMYFRKFGEVVTMPLKEWVDIYWNWKMPFVEYGAKDYGHGKGTVT